MKIENQSYDNVCTTNKIVESEKEKMTVEEQDVSMIVGENIYNYCLYNQLKGEITL